jgi:hypothetical protein
MSENRFADADAERSRWLDAKLRADRVDEVKIPGLNLCKRGHRNWGRHKTGPDRKVRRYCKTCHAQREAGRRARGEES